MSTTHITNIYKGVFKQNAALFAALLLIAAFISSCKKQGLSGGTPYSIKVFNGIDGGVNLYGSYNGNRPDKFITSISIPNRRASLNANFIEANVNGNYFAVPDTLAKDQPVFEGNFNLASSIVNTLYLMGDKSSVDYIFAPLNYKRYTAGDSLTFLSFVNISNEQPVSVNIKGMANGNLLNQLAYKQISDVIELPVGVANAAYDLEFRDAATGDLLTTFLLNNSNPAVGYFNTYLYKNTSLVLVGKRGQTGANKLEVVRVGYD